jgi:transcriptional antiterminator Rof (Rho-off)
MALAKWLAEVGERQQRKHGKNRTMSEPYIPIACSLHDQYEIAIMHKKHLKIKWSDESNVSHTASVLPTDILVKDRQEFLLAEGEDDEDLCIRLDKVEILQP